MTSLAGAGEVLRLYSSTPVKRRGCCVWKKIFAKISPVGSEGEIGREISEL